MARRRGRKKKTPSWLYPTLWGVLLVLVALLVYPRDSDDLDVQIDQPQVVHTPVYEDVTVVPEKVISPEHVVKPKIIPPQQDVSQDVVKPKLYKQVKRKGIALIIDDVGYDLAALKRILELPFPIAISIIPDAPYAKKAAEMAHQAHQVVMLHMPMEPSNPHYRARMDDSFLRATMGEKEVEMMLQKGFAKVPYVVGMNNHMGSLLTAMPEPMGWVMQFCRDKGIFFVDSKTSAKSVAAKVAKSYGVTWASRRVFLDNSTKPKDMEKVWYLAQVCGSKQGGCIMIGHPHAETLNFLEKHLASSRSEMISVLDLLHQSKP